MTGVRGKKSTPRGSDACLRLGYHAQRLPHESTPRGGLGLALYPVQERQDEGFLVRIHGVDAEVLQGLIERYSRLIGRRDGPSDSFCLLRGCDLLGALFRGMRSILLRSGRVPHLDPPFGEAVWHLDLSSYPRRARIGAGEGYVSCVLS